MKADKNVLMYMKSYYKYLFEYESEDGKIRCFNSPEEGVYRLDIKSPMKLGDLLDSGFEIDELDEWDEPLKEGE